MSRAKKLPYSVLPELSAFRSMGRPTIRSKSTMLGARCATAETGFRRNSPDDAPVRTMPYSIRDLSEEGGLL